MEIKSRKKVKDQICNMRNGLRQILLLAILAAPSCARAHRCHEHSAIGIPSPTSAAPFPSLLDFPRAHVATCTSPR